MQLAIHMVQNRRAGEQKSHLDETNKENYHVFCLSCPSATFALQRGGFVPREWLAAKGLFDSSRNYKDFRVQFPEILDVV